jgi:hypothetical protein
MAGRRAPTRRRAAQEELASRLRKLLNRAAKSLSWKPPEKARWESRLDSGFETGSPQARRLSEHLFRLAGRLNGPAMASEARRLAAVLRILNEVPRAESEEGALRDAVTALRDGLEFQSATGFLYGKAENRLVPAVVVGSHVDLIPDFCFDHGVGLSSWVAKTRRPVLLAALRRDAEMPETDRPSSFLSIPLIDDENLIGVLNLAHCRSGAFTPADRDFVVLASRFVVPTLRRLREPGSTSDAAGFGGKIGSRRQLEVRVLEAERASERGQKSFALVGLTLHPGSPGSPSAQTHPGAGLARAVDGYLRRLNGEDRVVCSLGSGAIAVLLPHVTSQEAWRIVADMREHLVAECAPHQSECSLQIASVVYPRDVSNAPEMISRVENILGIGGGRSPAVTPRLAWA